MVVLEGSLFETGDGVTSSSLIFATGVATDKKSGSVLISTGSALAGQSGDVTMSVGSLWCWCRKH